MPLIKGLVLLSRFEYLENKYGTAAYREFLEMTSTADHNFSRQPVDTANLYVDDLLVTIDQKLLETHFKQDMEEFRKLGEWNARNLMPKYFQLYLSEQNPVEFLEQFARLREMLIGSGDTKISVLDKHSVHLSTNYGQPIPRTVCLSEQGFLAEGLRLCGVRKVKMIEESCASQADNFECRFKVLLDKNG
jgi:predicted hydrocarbon binding protein